MGENEQAGSGRGHLAQRRAGRQRGDIVRAGGGHDYVLRCLRGEREDGDDRIFGGGGTMSSLLVEEPT